jgi:hypothetical protein
LTSTDGETNRGIKFGVQRVLPQAFPQATQTAATFAVKVGPADAKALGRVAAP